MKFILVTHHFFVNSEGFSKKEINVESESEAELLRLLEEKSNDSAFRHASTLLVPIKDTESLYEPVRKLSLKERLLGVTIPRR